MASLFTNVLVHIASGEKISENRIICNSDPSRRPEACGRQGTLWMELKSEWNQDMDSIDYFDKRKRKLKEKALEEEWNSFRKDQAMSPGDSKKDAPPKKPPSESGSENQAGYP